MKRRFVIPIGCLLISCLIGCTSTGPITVQYPNNLFVGNDNIDIIVECIITRGNGKHCIGDSKPDVGKGDPRRPKL